MNTILDIKIYMCIPMLKPKEMLYFLRFRGKLDKWKSFSMKQYPECEFGLFHYYGL